MVSGSTKYERNTLLDDFMILSRWIGLYLTRGYCMRQSHETILLYPAVRSTNVELTHLVLERSHETVF